MIPNKMESEKTRCFIALDLPKEITNHLKKIQTLIKKKSLFIGKFTEPENLHLTLKFLGEINQEEIEKVHEKLNKIKFNEFETELKEVGVFSSKYKKNIKMIWIKVGGKNISDLQKQVDNSLKNLFKPEIRFMSHITIARVKKVFDKKTLIEYLKKIKPIKIKFKINEFYLKESELFPEGPIYKNLEKYKMISPTAKF